MNVALDEDISRELTVLAELHMEAGRLDEASKVIYLVEQFERRNHLKKTQQSNKDVIQMSDWKSDSSANSDSLG